MPPRHGKSELISRFTPAWFLGRFPDRKIILASYADTFAAHWGRKARDVLKEEAPLFGVTLNQDTAGGAQWELMPGANGMAGVMVTAGVGGGITGKGANLLIIDDPVKNAAEAHSETTRDAHWEWWLSTARTRLQPGAAVIVVMTRWHEDDLVGRLLLDDPTRSKDGDLLPDGERRKDVEGDEWEIINLPAIAEAPAPEDATASLDTDDDTPRVYSPGWTDAIGRTNDEVLWPEMYDRAWMKQTRAALGLYWFTALYQQQPSPASGMLFKRKHFLYYTYDEIITEGGQRTFIISLVDREGNVTRYDSAYCTKFCTADVAASEKQQSDYTVVATWYVTPKHDLILWALDRIQFDSTKTPGFVKGVYNREKPSIIAIERLGHGLNVIQTLVNEGYPITKLEADTDKISRSLPATVRYEQGTVYHPARASWLEDFEKELLMFPNAKNDDQVDVVSYAAIKLPQISGGHSRSSSQNSGRESQRARSGARTRGRPLTAGFRGTPRADH